MSIATSLGGLFAKFSFSQIISWGPTIARVVSRGASVNAIKDDLNEPQIQALIPGVSAVIPFLETLGGLLFPKVSPALQAAAGAVTMSSDYTAKIQKLINQVQPPAPLLDVDGDYGPLTKKAILAYQTSRGLKPDEFAGDVTLKALMDDAAKPLAPASVAPAARTPTGA